MKEQKENYSMEMRIELLKSGLKMQDVAKEMGILRPNLSRLFRNGITREKKERIEEAIKNLKKKEVKK